MAFDFFSIICFSQQNQLTSQPLFWSKVDRKGTSDQRLFYNSIIQTQIKYGHRRRQVFTKYLSRPNHTKSNSLATIRTCSNWWGRHVRPYQRRGGLRYMTWKFSRQIIICGAKFSQLTSFSFMSKR